MSEIRVSVSEARQRLPELLRMIEAGDTVIVSRHALPIVLMTSLTEDREPELVGRPTTDTQAARGKP